MYRHNRSLTERTDITDEINQLPNTPGHRTSSASMYDNASSSHTVSLCQLTEHQHIFVLSVKLGRSSQLSNDRVPFLSYFLQPYFLFVLLSLTFLFDHLPKIPIKPL